VASNTRVATVVRNGQQQVIESMHIMPGDIVYAKKGDKFPVDCILVSSAYDDGTVFIETAELDGYFF
jgi:phospholipid-transporting ATPase